jgi:4-hydroxy-tetrahydrodipicolinate synthase
VAPLRLAFNLGTFPMVIKEGLELLGIDAGCSARPIRPLKESERQKLKSILQGMGLL